MKTPDEWVTWAAPWSQKSSEDLKRAIIERDGGHEREKAGLRRLIEEAQTDAKKHALVNVALRAEVDRLKGELAEAEHLVREAMGRPEWTGWYTRAQQHFAATPAEQAQGEAAKCGKSWTEMLPKPAPTGGLLDDVNAQVVALVKRVDVHDTGARQIMQALERMAHRVDALDDRIAKLGGELFDHEVTCPCPPKAPAPPPDYAHNHEFRQWEREGWPDRCGVRVREGDDPICCQPADWYGHIKATP